MITDQEVREGHATAQEVLSEIKSKEKLIARRPEPIRSDDGRIIGYRMVKITKSDNDHKTNIEMKKCKKCGIEKLSTEFGRNKKYRDGINCYCKECINAGFREAYAVKHNKPVLVSENEPNSIIADDLGSKLPLVTVCKQDEGKLRHDLVPADWHVALAEVMTHGISKYKPNTWRQIDPDQIVGALMRHFCAWRRGETNDTESQLNHLKHVMANAAILLSITSK